MADDLTLTGLYYYDTGNIPTNLTATLTSPNTLYVSWTAPQSVNLQSYNVYYGYDNTFNYQFAGNTTNTYYVLSGLTSNNTYYVAVQSILYDSSAIIEGIDTFQNIEFGINWFAPALFVTGIVSGFPLYGTQPTNVRTNYYNDSTINILWDLPINTGFNYSGYRIWRADYWNSQFYSIGSTESKFYLDSGLINKSYYYRVTSLF